MEATSVAPTTYSSGTGTTAASSASSAKEAYDLFLSVLTTQLETQNPLDPTSTDEMTSQLIAYSQVEQQIQTNEYLESLVLSTNEQSAETALGFVGKDVTYGSASQNYDDDDLTWSVDVPDNTESLKFEVFNESGSKVYETEASPSSQSTYDFVWDGSTTADGMADAGTYTLQVSATLQNGATKDIDARASSRANEVVWSAGFAELVLANGAKIGLDDVVSARDPNAYGA